MQQKQLKQMAPVTFDEIDFTVETENESVAHTNITFWIPVGIKEKYDKLQGLSKRKFGRKLKAAIITSITQVEDPTEDKAS